MKNQPKQVFISYSMGDNDIALALEKELRQYDLNVWIGKHVQKGKKWRRPYSKGFESSDAIIAIITKHAKTSTQVLLDFDSALLNAQFVGGFFPVLIGDDLEDLSLLHRDLSIIGALRLSSDSSPDYLGKQITIEFIKYLESR